MSATGERSRPFSELRNGMSPAAQTVASALTEQLGSSQIDESPSKRLSSPWAGDKPAKAELKIFTFGYDQGIREGRVKRRAQKVELQRLNKVIQQMSWKLHQRRWPSVEVGAAGFLAGTVFAAVVAIIAWLVF